MSDDEKTREHPSLTVTEILSLPGLLPAESLFLILLNDHESKLPEARQGIPLSSAEITSQLGVAPGTASKLTNHLKQMEFITITRGEPNIYHLCHTKIANFQAKLDEAERARIVKYLSLVLNAEIPQEDLNRMIGAFWKVSRLQALLKSIPE
jgi:hypothetical protein